ncbi:FMN-binding glutamate synthase family protein [Pseudenhygromyxa sp. WMMC2535]|uniref:FMN-binding glutamate synthase family protein n=1 Tax=Pseudenhygromyxa sp. WMMC2535 TaxID=2712867 RepID=UPI001552918B|nr:FMN-binding glutamate synthase family protein [Pseudenhygromyxa sp. WMMC2535]NVB41335.1 FMN-binding glutamate synthase family protein [Pseudenhygromyxa sp. WMMC2535]
MSPRAWFWLASIVAIGTIAGLALLWPPILIAYLVIIPLFLVGIYDFFQTKHAILRNFPVIGHGRYLLEAIRPEINQYFIESNTDGMPFDREQRSVVYQRAKGVNDTTPFGTQLDVYLPGFEWLEHSLQARQPAKTPPRLTIGGPRCAAPYTASLLNVSAMSYGSLSHAAVEALNRGAARGSFAHNTGEGGISPYHLRGGGDLIWQIGTGYFGCRNAGGGFDAKAFVERATLEPVKMIEIKLSQGAKPGHGGILPAVKLTREIAEIRGVPMGHDVLSPPCHSAFDTPIGLLRFVAELRELSGGKPVGFKLCIGRRDEFLSIVRAMLDSDLLPDFITVDGAEGGTGAAPLEFANHIGMPLTEGLVFVHSALQGAGLRERLALLCSGKIASGFDIARALAIGADACYSARAMMFALGCIQARRCNHNDCPTGIATQKPSLVAGLEIEDKADRVFRFHHNTIHAFLELLGAAGFEHPRQLQPQHINRRIDFHTTRHYGELFDYLQPGALLADPLPPHWAQLWTSTHAEHF